MHLSLALFYNKWGNGRASAILQKQDLSNLSACVVDGKGKRRKWASARRSAAKDEATHTSFWRASSMRLMGVRLRSVMSPPILPISGPRTLRIGTEQVRLFFQVIRVSKVGNV